MENKTQATPRRKTSFNFGVKGWLFTLYCCVAWMFISGGWWNGTAQNTMVSIKAEQLGVEAARILGINGAVGYVSLIVLLFIGMAFGKYKTHIVQTLIMVLGGIAICFYGMVNTVATYCLIFLCLDIMANATSNIGLPQMCVQWFPTKKGSVLGWATIGTNLAALVTLTIFNALIAKQGVVVTNVVFGVATIIMGRLNWFFIPDDPRKVGFEPDNGDFTPEELEAHRKLMTGPEVWTNKEAMKNKNFWLLGLAYGMLFMASTGFLSQLVPYQISMNAPDIANGLIASGAAPNPEAAAGMAKGIAAGQAAKLMKFLPLFALPGSILSGWIDQKIGTRKCGMLMAAFYAVAGLCAGFLPYNKITNYAFIFIFFWWTGANANLAMSHVGSVFGPRDYPHVYGRLQFLINLLRVTAPFVLSFALAQFGTYRWAYKVFCVLSIVAFIMLLVADNRIDKKPGEAPTAAYKD